MLDDAVHRAFALGLPDQMERALRELGVTCLFEHLVLDKLALATRTADAGLAGQGHFTVFYSPVSKWKDAREMEAVGQWVYGEWSEKIVHHPLDSGAILSGSRIIVAKGLAKRAGNGTSVTLDKLALGLVREAELTRGMIERPMIHFVAAANMDGQGVSSTCLEHDFFSAIMGFIHIHGDRAVPAIYPLKQGAAR